MSPCRQSSALAAEVERERTRQTARIGSNLSQFARWTNTYGVPVIASLVSFEWSQLAVAHLDGEGGEVH